jgi:hypothetical protein
MGFWTHDDPSLSSFDGEFRPGRRLAAHVLSRALDAGMIVLGTLCMFFVVFQAMGEKLNRFNIIFESRDYERHEPIAHLGTVIDQLTQIPSDFTTDSARGMQMKTCQGYALRAIEFHGVLLPGKADSEGAPSISFID